MLVNSAVHSAYSAEQEWKKIMLSTHDVGAYREESTDQLMVSTFYSTLYYNSMAEKYLWYFEGMKI